MIRTGKEMGECINCDGTGTFDVTRCCPHGCTAEHLPEKCETCDGTGQCEYDQYKYDPDCRYCVDRQPHPLSWFLPEIKAQRGGIQFS